MDTKIVAVIDQDGFFVEDRVVHQIPIVGSNGLPVIDSNGNIQTQWPPLDLQDVEVRPPEGLFRPRWDGQQWIEGLNPQAILDQSAPPEPNWEKLVKELGDRPEILSVLGGCTNPIALIALIAEVKMARDRYEIIKTHWDGVIDSFRGQIPERFHLEINLVAKECHIPLSVGENNRMILPQ